MSNGEATWETLIRGLEADLSYHFDPEKIRVAREALARRSMEQADYPDPDLAIEIDMSGPKVDRPAIYADLSVAEVWRLGRGKEFVIEHAPGGRILRRGRGEPVPGDPCRCHPRMARPPMTGSTNGLGPSPESMGDGIGPSAMTGRRWDAAAGQDLRKGASCPLAGFHWLQSVK